MNPQFTDPLALLQCCYALLRLNSPIKCQTSIQISQSENDHIRIVTKKQQNLTLFNSLCIEARSKLNNGEEATRKTNTCTSSPKSFEIMKQNCKRQQIPILSELELKKFLTKRPKPSWGRRLEKLNQYDPSYITGWYPNLSKVYASTNTNNNTNTYLCILPNAPIDLPKKIIIDKAIFKKCADLTTKNNTQEEWIKSYKSAQRGIEEYFKRNNYKRQCRYTRKKLQFILKED
ncbi:hypothetical protein M0812_23369 [Anaeramoeba flamelloides]|uniref:Uncharacterized protein n=1 Tax=Anaeramoeba flamelloides TaxID=1746091 RepID=A0AAV7YLJ8_9EUKA|nr:hypothetical protein M0812_23369 [Anaeramoeba flamelloides]